MTTPSWILLIAPTVALAIGVITVWAALIGNRRTNATALQNAQLASYTTFEASCTKDRLDTVTRFIDAIAEVLDDPQHKTKDKVWSEFHRIQVAFQPGGAPVDVAREMRDTVVDLMTHDEVKPAAGVERDRWMAETPGATRNPSSSGCWTPSWNSDTRTPEPSRTTLPAPIWTRRSTGSSSILGSMGRRSTCGCFSARRQPELKTTRVVSGTRPRSMPWKGVVRTLWPQPGSG